MMNDGPTPPPVPPKPQSINSLLQKVIRESKESYEIKRQGVIGNNGATQQGVIGDSSARLEDGNGTASGIVQQQKQQQEQKKQMLIGGLMDEPQKSHRSTSLFTVSKNDLQFQLPITRRATVSASAPQPIVAKAKHHFLPGDILGTPQTPVKHSSFFNFHHQDGQQEDVYSQFVTHPDDDNLRWSHVQTDVTQSKYAPFSESEKSMTDFNGSNSRENASKPTIYNNQSSGDSGSRFQPFESQSKYQFQTSAEGTYKQFPTQNQQFQSQSKFSSQNQFPSKTSDYTSQQKSPQFPTQQEQYQSAPFKSQPQQQQQQFPRFSRSRAEAIFAPQGFGMPHRGQRPKIQSSYLQKSEGATPSLNPSSSKFLPSQHKPTTTSPNQIKPQPSTLFDESGPTWRRSQSIPPKAAPSLPIPSIHSRSSSFKVNLIPSDLQDATFVKPANETRRCLGCFEVKPSQEYSNTQWRKLNGYCKQCVRMRVAQRQKLNNGGQR